MEFSPKRFGLLLIAIGLLVIVAGLAVIPWSAWNRARTADHLLIAGLVTSGTVTEVRHEPGGQRGARYSFLDEKGRRIEGWLATPGFRAPNGATVTTVEASATFPAEGSVMTVAYDAAHPQRHAAWNAEAPAAGQGMATLMAAMAMLASGVFLALIGGWLAWRRPVKK